MPGDFERVARPTEWALIGLLILIALFGSLTLRIWPALQMTDVEQIKLARPPTKNLEAYDYYLRAENEGLYNGTNAAPARAMAAYAKAVELDPNFADAQAGFALAARKFQSSTGIFSPLRQSLAREPTTRPVGRSNSTP